MTLFWILIKDFTQPGKSLESCKTPFRSASFHQINLISILPFLVSCSSSSCRIASCPYSIILLLHNVRVIISYMCHTATQANLPALPKSCMDQTLLPLPKCLTWHSLTAPRVSFVTLSCYCTRPHTTSATCFRSWSG